MAQTESPILRFVRDISGNDPKIVEKVTAYLAQPPSTDEEIGYYGGSKRSPEVRAWLATVSALREAGYVDGFEDKYSHRLAELWEEAGLIDRAAFSPAGKTVFVEPDIDWEDEAAVTKLAEDFRASYPAATREIERQMADRGKILLQVDDAGGDTMLFVAVTPEFAAKWENKAFASDRGEQFGVRAPDWRRFWHHLTYAFGFGVRGRSFDDTPPADLPQRNPALPMAQ